MTAPFSVTFRHGPAPHIPPAPLTVAVLAANEAANLAGNAPVDEYTLITEANADTVLGASGLVRTVYDLIETYAAVHVYVVPFDPGSDSTERTAGGVAAINAMATPAELTKLQGLPPNFVLLLEEPSGAATANAILAHLRGVIGPGQGLEGACIFTDAAQDSQANAVAWAGANGGSGGVWGVANGGTVGSGAIKGAGPMLAHYLRYAARDGIGVNPIGLTFPVAGLTTPSPAWGFSFTDPTAAAEVIADAHVSSFITSGGGVYLWGGTAPVTPSGSPLQYVGNRLIAFEMVRRVRRALVEHVGRSGVDPDALAITANNRIRAFVDNNEVRSAVVHDVTISGVALTASLAVTFHRAIDSVSLTVEVS